ncbi:MAG: hypothetical protein ACRD2I_22685, partial [Vicinamibacterales bacterium]
AWGTWAAVCLTVPFVPHSWLIFPEMPGTLLVAWAALWLYAPLPSHERTWIWRGAALAFLPWLHTKFVILLATMLAALLLRVWRQRRAAAALATPAIVSVALWLYSFHALYGVFDPQIPYGDFPKLYVLFSNIPRGVLGLLFDQKFGLLMYAPVYLVAIPGCWMMLRQPQLRQFSAAVLGTVVVFVASSTRMYMWWGGSSAPARFLVPILPLLAPMIAVALHRIRSTAARAMSMLLLIVSTVVAMAGSASPRRFTLFSAPHGLSNLAAAVQGPAPLSNLLPTFTEGTIGAPLALLAPWACAAVVAMIGLLLVSRRRSPSAGVMPASAALTVFIVAGAVLAGDTLSASQQHAMVLRGRLALLQDNDGSALRGLDYSELTWLDQQQLLTRSALHLSQAGGDLTADGVRFAGPFALPPGRFTVRSVSGGAAGDGAPSISVLIGDQAVLASGPATIAAPLTFAVPVGAPVRFAAPNQALASTVSELDVAAESVVPRSARITVNARTIESIAGRPGAFIIYADAETYPEGGVFWTEGTASGKVLVAPAGATTLALTLHLGPVAGAVRVTVDSQDHFVTLARDETLRLDVPLPNGARLVPIVVAAPGSFRPSDHDPRSTDHRRLGCQVRIELR